MRKINKEGILCKHMPKIKEVMLFIILAISILSIVQANQQSLPPVKQNSCVRLYQTCPNCTQLVLTNVVYNGTNETLNQIMSTSDNFDYYTHFCNTSFIGDYIVNGYGDVDGIKTGFAYNFEVTATGDGFSTAQSNTYIVLFIVTLLIFIGLLWVALIIPSGNKREEMYGYIIAISNLKYVKMVLFGLAYLALLFIMFFIYNMCYAYLSFGFVTSIFYTIFIAMTIILVPFYALLIYFAIVNLVKDNNIQDFLSRGLKTY